MPRPPKRRIPPVSSGCLLINDRINAELALYNQTGNMLALWAVVGICARKGLPLPRGVRSRVLKISNTLLRYAAEDTPRARESVADLVLDTYKDTGGPSQFEQYRLKKRDRDIVTRVRELLIEEQVSLERHEKVRSGNKTKVKKNTSLRPKTSGSRGGKPDAPPVIRTQTAIYEQVAEEFCVQPETAKRLFEQDDRAAGSLGYRVIRENRNKVGIIDI